MLAGSRVDDPGYIFCVPVVLPGWLTASQRQMRSNEVILVCLSSAARFGAGTWQLKPRGSGDIFIK